MRKELERLIGSKIRNQLKKLIMNAQPNATNLTLGAFLCASLGACAAWGFRLLGLTRSTVYQPRQQKSQAQGVQDAEEQASHDWGPEELRQQASIHADNRNSYFAQSQSAYQGGNKRLAKELSDKGKEEQALMEQFNAAAANMFFNRNNKSNTTGEIDLHGLHVKEAISIVEDKLKEARRENKKVLVFIVGVGNHSTGGVVKLKPAVERLMEQYNLACTYGVPRKGCLYVELDAPKRGWSDSCSPDTATTKGQDSSCIIC